MGSRVACAGGGRPDRLLCVRPPLAVAVICLSAGLVAACPSPPRDGEVREEDDRGEPDERDGTDEALGEGEVGPSPDDVEPPHDTDVVLVTCPPGAGGRPCDDGDPCTDDSCLASGCAHVPNLVACDDGDPCTELDRCQAGQCLGVAKDCDDAEACTVDACAGGGCVHTPREGPCDDLSLCTVGDRCVEGRCVGADVECAGGGPCRVAVCEPRTGCGLVAVDGPCDDFDACTEDTACVDGVCRGALLACDDGDVCTDDYCDPRVGCTHRDNRAPCDDGDRCTIDDRCAAGVCGGVLAGTCCESDAACDDGDPCSDDRCEGPNCVHVVAACDDADACTLDRCEGGACVHARWADLPDEGHLVADFEGALDGWTMTSTNPAVGWRADTRWSASGSGSLYCGDEAGAGYDHGATRATASVRVAVPPVDPELHLFVRSDVGDLGSCTYDALEILIDDTPVGRVCGSTEGERRLSLAAAAGREATLSLVFDTIDAVDNGGLGVWVDRLRITAGPCP